MEDTLPFWALSQFVAIGAEEEEISEGSENEDPQDENEEDSSEESHEEDTGTESLAGLKAALRRERQLNREATRKLTKLERASQRRTQAEESELERTKRELTESSNRSQRLAEGFKKVRVDSAIERVARKLKFRDTDDALAMVDRNLITVDQDEDDPSDIDIDSASVETAVKKLAAAKKHLLASGTEDDDATGGQFGRKKGSKQTSEDEYRQKYSAL